jgi:hypothetical protein
MSIAGLLMTTTLRAQPPPEPPPPAPSTDWDLKSSVGLNISQSTFNGAWVGDEVGTFTWSLISNSEANKLLSPRWNWSNSLLLQFGQTHQQNAERTAWLAPLKSSDKITYRSLLRYLNKWKIDPFIAFDLDTQFYTEDRSLDIFELFTPARLSESIGFARAFADTDQRRLITRFGFAVRQLINRTYVRSLTPLEVDTRITNDGGLEWFTQWRLANATNRASYQGEVRLYKAAAVHTNEGASPLYWPAVDLDWQNTLSSKLTAWLSFDLFWQLLYDKQIDQRGQFKQTLGLGLTWQLLGPEA